MNQMSPMKLAIAGSTVVCAALLSFGWSEQRGVSLSIESAQARVGRPLTPVSVAGVARRQNRRAAYGYGGYGYGRYGYGAAAVGTGAVAAGYYGNRYYGYRRGYLPWLGVGAGTYQLRLAVPPQLSSLVSCLPIGRTA